MHKIQKMNIKQTGMDTALFMFARKIPRSSSVDRIWLPVVFSWIDRKTHPQLCWAEWGQEWNASDAEGDEVDASHVNLSWKGFLPLLGFAAYRLRLCVAPPLRGVVGSRRHIRSHPASDITSSEASPNGKTCRATPHSFHTGVSASHSPQEACGTLAIFM